VFVIEFVKGKFSSEVGRGEGIECWEAQWAAGGEVMLSIFILLGALRLRTE
jgi:hypothetical protein